MNPLRYTLVADGPSDRALVPILDWLLIERGVQRPIHKEIADLRRLPDPPKSLSERITRAVELFPCHILFVHRDAEKASRKTRVREIQRAWDATGAHANAALVCVIPIRMQEAWLLFDEGSIRRAAGNPNGRNPLAMPDLAHLEGLPNPKRILQDLLREAGGLFGRRKAKMNVNLMAQQIGYRVASFSPLRRLAAFQALEEELALVLQNISE